MIIDESQQTQSFAVCRATHSFCLSSKSKFLDWSNASTVHFKTTRLLNAILVLCGQEILKWFFTKMSKATKVLEAQIPVDWQYFIFQ